MKTITIEIKGQQDHIKQYNRSESFISELKAREYLSEWLHKLNSDEMIQHEITEDMYFDCRDYHVFVTVSE